MAEAEIIQSVVTQVAAQSATEAVMAMRDVDAGPISDANTASLREVHIQRHGRPALKNLQTSMQNYSILKW